MPVPFPALDPIPLPAPVWLFKILHNLTLTLHFTFLHSLLGGLALCVLFNLLGHLLKSPRALSASGVLAARLPIMTTYVINLGIPPLLFAQVLYGRALYTSSILIGAYWISVIFALLWAYFILYRMGTLAGQGKPWWFWALASLLLLMGVGAVYSTNMTLMLKPEDWPALYDASASGIYLPPFDPTRWPRYAVMMLGSLSIGALISSLYTGKSNLAEEVKQFLRFWCGIISLLTLPFLAAAGTWAFRSQPETIQQALLNSSLHRPLLSAWPVLLFLCALGSLFLVFQPRAWSFLRAVFILLPAFLSVASYVILRDGVRDLTLAQKGFDVWASPVYTNWPVVYLFLVFFLIGLAVLAWLLMVLRKAVPAEERYG
jgi:hypothetical protein